MCPQAFSRSLQGSGPLPQVAAATLADIISPLLHDLLLLTVSLLCFLVGLLAHQVSLSHICSASWAKFDEGLQHNTHRVYQSKQQTF